jgi:hypothetical protein
VIATPQLNELAPALSAAQAEMVGIKKTKQNPHLKNKYAGLDDILDVVRPVLAKHGLSLVQGTDLTSKTGEVVITSTILHKSGQWITAAMPLPLAKNTVQEVGSLVTYGRRYLVSSQLAIAAEDDDDGNAASGVTGKPSAPVTPQAGDPPRATGTPIPGGSMKGQMLEDLTVEQLGSLLTEVSEKAPGNPFLKKVEARREKLVKETILQPAMQAIEAEVKAQTKAATKKAAA